MRGTAVPPYSRFAAHSLDMSNSILRMLMITGMVIVAAGMIVPLFITRITREQIRMARRDLVAIRDAVRQHHDDTGAGPTRGFDGEDGGLARLCGAGAIAVGSYYRADGHQGWLRDHLLRNEPAGPWSEGYSGWNGPYLPDVRPDPWGNAYVVVVYPLQGADRRDCLVVSAGPNGRMDSSYASPLDGTPSGDDLIEVVREN